MAASSHQTATAFLRHLLPQSSSVSSTYYYRTSAWAIVKRHWEGRTNVALRVRVAFFWGGFTQAFNPMDSHNPFVTFELPMREETYALSKVVGKKKKKTFEHTGVVR